MCQHLEALIAATMLCIHALPYTIMCRDMPCNRGVEIPRPPGYGPDVYMYIQYSIFYIIQVYHVQAHYVGHAVPCSTIQG